ncbi:hypothetical protein QYE76_041615 [Lolium multiflorum]|uniref:Uncharacterized protein n=1 Tax=Lolium multiflorum TaxID=4521 RepID=A0AAD8TFB4_LOLMU|nr:hypothetical protein QYE76_041615 [Lolium multiflorum]
MQVLATVAPLDGQETEDEDSTPDPEPSNAGSPLSRERPGKAILSPEEMVEQARMDLVAQSDILNSPITPESAADLEALEARRKQMLATAKKFADTAAAMLDERTEAANFVAHFKKKDQEIDESLAQVRKLEEHWEAKVKFVAEEEARIRREAIPPRRITFATPTEQQPLATPKDNMKKAAELLKKKDEEIDIDFVRKLVASAMQQQREKPENIQTRSRFLRIQLRETQQRARVPCILAETSTVFLHHHPELRVRHSPLVAAVQPETLDPMGQVESTSATCHRLGTGIVRWSHAGTGTKTQSLSLVGTKTASLSLGEVKDASLSLAEVKDASQNLGGAGTKSAPLSLAGAGTTEATTTKRKGATEAGVSRGSSAESPKAEDHLTGPLADPHRRHPVEAEAEAEAGDPVPAQSHPAAVLATLGSASTSTDPTTLVQGALAG